MTTTSFHIFSATHWSLVGITALMTCAAYCLGGTGLAKNKETFIRQVIAIGMLLFEGLSPFVAIFTKHVPLEEALPIHMCDFSRILIAMYLLYSVKLYMELAYYWGISGGLIAIFTPDIKQGFPSLEILSFFTSHAILFMAIAYVLTLNHYKPTFKGMLAACGCGILVSLGMYALNTIIGGAANYWYLMLQPQSSNGFYDFLPAQPWHLLAYYGIASTMFYMLYLTSVAVKTVRIAVKRHAR